MGHCFSCKKEISFFDYKQDRKEILMIGYQPPENMNDYDDKLCRPCLDELANNQTRGRKRNKGVNLKWQMVLAIFAPGFSALRIEKWLRFNAMAFLVDVPIIVVFFGLAIWAEMEFLMAIAVIFYLVSPFDIYIIHKWTKEWNEDAI
jgi:hypothetical protein